MIDFTLTENRFSKQGNHNMFSLHKESKFPIIWDVENITIVNSYIQLLDSYQYKNSKDYKKQMD